MYVTPSCRALHAEQLHLLALKMQVQSRRNVVDRVSYQPLGRAGKWTGRIPCLRLQPIKLDAYSHRPAIGIAIPSVLPIPWPRFKYVIGDGCRPPNVRTIC